MCCVTSPVLLPKVTWGFVTRHPCQTVPDPWQGHCQRMFSLRNILGPTSFLLWMMTISLCVMQRRSRLRHRRQYHKSLERHTSVRCPPNPPLSQCAHQTLRYHSVNIHMHIFFFNILAVCTRCYLQVCCILKRNKSHGFQSMHLKELLKQPFVTTIKNIMPVVY